MPSQASAPMRVVSTTRGGKDKASKRHARRARCALGPTCVPHLDYHHTALSLGLRHRETKARRRDNARSVMASARVREPTGVLPFARACRSDVERVAAKEPDPPAPGRVVREQRSLSRATGCVEALGMREASRQALGCASVSEFRERRAAVARRRDGAAAGMLSHQLRERVERYQLDWRCLNHCDACATAAAPRAHIVLCALERCAHAEPHLLGEES